VARSRTPSLHGLRRRRGRGLRIPRRRGIRRASRAAAACARGRVRRRRSIGKPTLRLPCPSSATRTCSSPTSSSRERPCGVLPPKPRRRANRRSSGSLRTGKAKQRCGPRTSDYACAWRVAPPDVPSSSSLESTSPLVHPLPGWSLPASAGYGPKIRQIPFPGRCARSPQGEIIATPLSY
jgi:hypothetical protein